MAEEITIGDIVSSPDKVMGVKAVWGPVTSHVLCFGRRGNFGLAESAAKKSAVRPWVFTIGGGAEVRDGVDGRVLNLVRVSAKYGETATFVDDAEAIRLARWPIAVMLHDVYNVVGHPRLVDDLGLPDRRVLAGAVDGIIRREQRIDALWEGLAMWPITLAALPLSRNFHDDGRPQLVSTILPMLRGSQRAEEGQRYWKLQRAIERDHSLASTAKELNRLKNGRSMCEACGFGSLNSAMFDAHHPRPLGVGQQTTLAEHLIILCPTCHRRAHLGAMLDPLPLDKLIAWNRTGRP